MIFKRLFKQSSPQTQETPPPPPDRSPNPNLTGNSFIDSNWETFEQLLTFIDFAEGFDLAFAQVNYPGDIDDLVQALQQSPKCSGTDFVVLDLSDPDIRYLKPEIQKRIQNLFTSELIKHVLIIRGLENSIGMYGDYPPILQDLNFVRDSLINDVPYPTIICLPDYAINRVIQYAPDLWSWQSGVFRFKSGQFNQDTASIRAFHAQKALGNLNQFERRERIDLLKRFIQDFKPTGEKVSKENLRVYVKALNELGRNYTFIGNFNQSSDIFKLALEASESEMWQPESHLDTEARLEALNRLGVSEYRLGHYLYSERLLTLALKVSKQKFPFQHASSLLYLGYLSSSNQPEKSITLCQKAIPIFDSISELSGKAVCIRSIGNVKKGQGDVNEALSLYQEALEIYTQIGDISGKASCLQSIGIIKRNQGALDEALSLCQEALKIYTQIGDISGKADCLQSIGIIKKEQGDINEALLLYQEDLAISKQFGDRSEEAYTLYWMAVLYIDQGQLHEAFAHLDQALDIFEQIGEAPSKARVLCQRARVHAQMGEIREARSLFEQALDIQERLGYLPDQAETLWHFGQALAEHANDIETGLKNLKTSLEIFQSLGYANAAKVQAVIESIQQQHPSVTSR